ncbi:MAG: hypothetical protein IKE69_08500 [Thermoguttaceae bacterium]|nr:hypothetical protein [Thermoguttaceae bacterium]
MNPIRVFYDDIYLYQEFSQPVEGQKVPLTLKIATGPKPGFESLARLIEETYAEAFRTQGIAAGDSESADAVPAPKLPVEYYAEHVLYLSRRGTVWHIEYHFYPEPEIYVFAEPGKAGRRDKGTFTRANLYDQTYTADGRDYVVTSLRGNYADFPGYSPFFLDKDREGVRRIGQPQLLAAGARFEKADRETGTRFDIDRWFLEEYVPRLLLGVFKPNGTVTEKTAP